MTPSSLRLWVLEFVCILQVADALSLNKEEMTIFLYLLIALFLFFIVLIISVCIHICRLSWAGMKERRSGGTDEETAELTDYPKQFRVRIERATESRSCREQSL